MVTQPASTEDAKDGKAQEKTEVQSNAFRRTFDVLMIVV